MYKHWSASTSLYEHRIWICIQVCYCCCLQWAYFLTYKGTHSSSLCLCDSTILAAVLSLSGRWGWGDVKSGWRVCCGEESDPSVMLFSPLEAQRWQKECHAERDDPMIWLLTKRRIQKFSQWSKRPSLIKCAHDLMKRRKSGFKKRGRQNLHKRHIHTHSVIKN